MRERAGLGPTRVSRARTISGEYCSSCEGTTRRWESGARGVRKEVVNMRETKGVRGEDWHQKARRGRAERTDEGCNVSNLGRHKRVRGAFSSRPPRAPHTVHVVLQMVRAVVVDHHHDLRHVQPAPGDGRGHHDGLDAALELVQGVVAVQLILRWVRVHGMSYSGARVVMMRWGVDNPRVLNGCLENIGEGGQGEEQRHKHAHLAAVQGQAGVARLEQVGEQLVALLLRDHGWMRRGQDEDEPVDQTA